MIYRALYNFFVLLLTFTIFLGRFFNAKLAKMWQGRRAQKLAPRDAREVILVHCSSLGEFEQGRVLIETLRGKCPEARLILTFFSSSGYEMRKNYAGVDEVYYLPLDRKRAVRKFLDTLCPNKVFIIKYEYWYNFLRELRGRGAEVYIVSAIFRRDSIFFKRCLGFGGFYRSMLGFFTKIFVQDAASKELLSEIGYSSEVVGDTRFDRVAEISHTAKADSLVESFARGESPVVVCGSTWAADEALLCEVMKRRPQWRFVIAPHEINQAHIQHLEQKCGRVSSRHTSGVLAQDCSLLIIDRIGLLSGLYQYGDVAYIGGGFGAGIHNTLEAAAWSKGVIFGTNYKKFREAAKLIELGAGFSVSTLEELLQRLDYAVENSQHIGAIAGSYVKREAGATLKIVNSIY